MDKWEVRVLPADQKGDAYLGVCCGGEIILAPVRNREEGEMICAAVNAIKVCAEAAGLEPLEFARRLESVPGFGLWVGFATDLVEDVLEGEPLKGGPPTGLLNDQTLEGA